MNNQLAVTLAIKEALESGEALRRADGGYYINNDRLAEVAIETMSKASPVGGSPVEERLRQRTHEIAETKDKQIGELKRELNRYRKGIDKVRDRLRSRVSPDKWEDLSWEARVTAFVVMQENEARERGANNAIKRAVQLGKQALLNASLVSTDPYTDVAGRVLERVLIRGELNSLVAGLDD